MADLTTVFAGKIRCPNPFWLASGPPANCGDQVMRAFDAGWGGAVWKTLGDPIVNVSSRYSSVDLNGQRMMGLNNIELITDRPLEVNLREITEVKKRYPNHAVIEILDPAIDSFAIAQLHLHTDLTIAERSKIQRLLTRVARRRRSGTAQMGKRRVHMVIVVGRGATANGCTDESG